MTSNRTIVTAAVVLAWSQGLASTAAMEPLFNGGAHVLEDSGKLMVRLSSWPSWKPAIAGFSVPPDAIFMQAKDGVAKILCPGHDEVVEYKSKAPGQLTCPQIAASSNVERRRHTSRSTGPRDHPRLLLPRNSYVYDTKPLIRWDPVPGIDEYTVELDGSPLDPRNAERELRCNEELVEGRAYSVTVSGGGTSSSDSGDNIAFRVLSAKERKQIKQRIKAIEDWSVSGPARSLSKALILEQQRAIADAIVELESVHGLPPAVVSYHIGDWYESLGAYDEAEKHLRAAYESAPDASIAKLQTAERLAGFFFRERTHRRQLRKFQRIACEIAAELEGGEPASCDD